MVADDPIRDLTPTERRNLIPHRYAVAVAGYPGAGKTTTAEIFSDCLDSTYVSSGDQVRKHATEVLGDDAGSDEIGAWIDDRIQEHGTTLISEWVVKELETTEPASYAVVDGVRSTPAKEFENCFDQFFIVLVHTDAEERYRRIQSRDKPYEEVSDTSEHSERDEREEAYGLLDLYENEEYDFYIDNNESIAELKESVAELATELP